MNEWPSRADIFDITHTCRDLVGIVRIPIFLQDFLLLFFFPQIEIKFLPNSSFQKKPMAVMLYYNSWLISHYLFENPTPKSSHLGNTAVCVHVFLCARVCMCVSACLSMYVPVFVSDCLFPHLHVLLPSYWTTHMSSLDIACLCQLLGSATEFYYLTTLGAKILSSGCVAGLAPSKNYEEDPTWLDRVVQVYVPNTWEAEASVYLCHHGHLALAIYAKICLNPPCLWE